MTTFTEQYVALTVAALKADGKADPNELKAIKLLAEGLGLEENTVDKLLIQEAKNESDPLEIARRVTIDKELLLESCAIVILADNKLTEKEVNLLLSIADAMNISAAKVVLSIASVTQHNQDIEIEGNEK